RSPAPRRRAAPPRCRIRARRTSRSRLRLSTACDCIARRVRHHPLPATPGFDSGPRIRYPKRRNEASSGRGIDLASTADAATTASRYEVAPERTNSCCFVNGFDRRQQCQLTRATGIDQKTLRRLESRPRGSIITTRELVFANSVRPLTSPWQAVPATPLSTSTSKRRRGRRCPCGIPIITLKHPPEQGRPLSLNCETS